MSKSDIEDKVRRVIGDILKVSADRIVPSALLVNDLGADGIDVVSVFMDLESEFGVAFPEDEVKTMNTVGAIVEYLQNAITQNG